MLRRLSVGEAVEAVRAGGVVAFPTETSYGLGCLAMDGDAVAQVIAAKGRPTGKPLPVLLPSLDELVRVQPDNPLRQLAEAFWPGPLTLVVPAFPGIPSEVTADTNMVGVRVSAHPLAQRLVQGVRAPIVATSANRSGEPAAATAGACDAAGLIGVEGVVDGGTVEGSASTVVGLRAGKLEVFREGPITRAQLDDVWKRSR